MTLFNKPALTLLIVVLIGGSIHAQPANPSSNGASTPVPARWKPRTTDWVKNAHPAIGDWGFDRPGYPAGLYLHGITVKAGDPVTNPVIYDNDVFDDVFDDEWAFAMASLGRMNLAALIVTPVLTDGWGFSHPDWVQTGREARERAVASSMDMARIPEITVGTEAKSEKAGERKDSAGARLYIKLINDHFQKDPDHPLLVNMGGQSATLASAFCLDPSIARKCIVYYTDIRVYNGHYSWASQIIAGNFRVVSWGDDHWWINKPCQNEWNVLPRPEKCDGNENNANSGEWRQLTAMHVPLLDHMVKQFQTRGEYCQGDKKADGYCDGTFIHAWLPGIFGDASLQQIRGSEVLHVMKFTAAGEQMVKEFTLKTLLNPAAYGRQSNQVKAAKP